MSANAATTAELPGCEVTVVPERIQNVPAKSAIEPARSMEAEDGPPRDTDAILRDRAQHQRAGRKAGSVDDDPLARLADYCEQLQIGANLAAWTRYDAQVSAGRNN